MKLSEAVTPISKLKAQTARLIAEVAEHHKTLVITRNGKAKAVLLDLASYEQVQDSLALLKILAQSSASAAAGRVRTAKRVLAGLRKSLDGASA
jgi:prevent-host-death family protein